MQSSPIVLPTRFDRCVRRLSRMVIAALCFWALAAVTGCGGTSVNGNLKGLSQPTATAAIYGIDQQSQAESSGLATQNLSAAYLTAAVSSTAVPLAGYGGAIPLGFSVGGAYQSGVFPSAASASATGVVFGIHVSNGVDSAGQVVQINPSSVVLTTPEVPGFSQALTFQGGNIGNNGPLELAQYYTGSFTLPFATTGIHTFVASVADAEGKTSTTTFDVPVLGPADAAVLAQVTDSNGNPLPGAVASITGADANGYVGPGSQLPSGAPSTDSVADANGMVLLFATPGAAFDKNGDTNTITVTVGTGASQQTATAPVPLVAGQLYPPASAAAPFSIAVGAAPSVRRLEPKRRGGV